MFQLQNVFNQVMVSFAKEELKKLRGKLGELERVKERIMVEEREKLKKQAERLKEVKHKRNEVEEVQKHVSKEQESLNKMQVSDKHITQEVSFKSEDVVKFERKVAETER